MRSAIQKRGAVQFADFTGERVYMREFTQKAGLPADLKRWQRTVDQMLDGVQAPGPIYLMVDQRAVAAGQTHRRPGVHVDGYWHPAIQAHGGDGNGNGFPPHHDLDPPPPPPPPWDHNRPWNFSGAGAEALLLASTVTACRAYVGEYHELPRKGGDCSHIDLSGMTAMEMEAGNVYAGHTLTMLHESIALPVACLRTVVRLNVPGVPL